jgi:very-short-patch-repair endonuclease
MNLTGVFQSTSQRIVSRRDLLSSGLSGGQITMAVRAGVVLRVRRDHYALPGTDYHTLEAVRVGGRLGCVSAASEMGIFAFDSTHTHLHVPRAGSRLRSPQSRFHRLADVDRGGVTVHWSPLIDPLDGTEFCVGAKDALSQIIQCQSRNFALAALDTALHEGRIERADLGEIFATVPDKYRPLRRRVDARVDSGQETVLRRIIVDAGFSCDIQVLFAGIGRVDILVEGCVVVEADSRMHHKSWEQHLRDRTRDRLLAARGYLTLRVLYDDIMFDPDGVIDAIRALVELCRSGSMHL